MNKWDISLNFEEARCKNNEYHFVGYLHFTNEKFYDIDFDIICDKKMSITKIKLSNEFELAQNLIDKNLTTLEKYFVEIFKKERIKILTKGTICYD